MAKIARSLSSRVNQLGTAEIYLRVTIGRGKQLRLRSGICVSPERFKDGRIVMPRANQRELAQLRQAEADLTELEAQIIGYCLEARAEEVTKQALERIVERYHHPAVEDVVEDDAFFSAWDAYISTKDVSDGRKEIYRCLVRTLHRFEIHRQQTLEPGFRLELDGMTTETVYDFEKFYRNEWKYYEEYPQLYTDYPAEVRPQHKTHRPSKRGDNMVVCTIKRLRAFFNWCNQQGLTDNRPFDRYEGKSEVYGTPFYLTIEERDRLADFDFSERPGLAAQRDIFIFQCLVGCRVSDLRGFKKSNIVGDMLEYVQQKTKRERTDVVRVPLCARAREIIKRYEDASKDMLLPCVSDQRYNDAIKEMCKICGIDRLVTVINPTTGKDERKKICDIASSHMARRTFIGNLYKQVKDPCLVSALSGHKPGSQAFARYREIDDDIKRQLIDLIK